MFQRPVWIIANIIFWVGLNPFLRLVVYPQLGLKPFIHGMEWISGSLILLQVISLWMLWRWPQRSWQPAHCWRALPLLPLVWLLNSLALWLMMEFDLLQDPRLEPLYDSQLFIKRYPISWTALGFLWSGVAEEIFFRAWLPDFLQKRWRRSLAMSGSALLFALAHVGPHTNGQALLAYALFALSLSYVRTLHGLAAAIGIHVLNNVLVYISQVFGLNLFTMMVDNPALLYTVLALLGGGMLLIGRDLLQMVDKGAEAP